MGNHLGFLGKLALCPLVFLLPWWFCTLQFPFSDTFLGFRFPCSCRFVLILFLFSQRLCPLIINSDRTYMCWVCNFKLEKCQILMQSWVKHEYLFLICQLWDSFAHTQLYLILLWCVSGRGGGLCEFFFFCNWNVHSKDLAHVVKCVSTSGGGWKLPFPRQETSYLWDVIIKHSNVNNIAR